MVTSILTQYRWVWLHKITTRFCRDWKCSWLLFDRSILRLECSCPDLVLGHVQIILSQIRLVQHSWWSSSRQRTLEWPAWFSLDLFVQLNKGHERWKPDISNLYPLAKKSRLLLARLVLGYCSVMEFENLNLSHGNCRLISTSQDAPISFFFFIFDSQELIHMFVGV